MNIHKKKYDIVDHKCSLRQELVDQNQERPFCLFVYKEQKSLISSFSYKSSISLTLHQYSLGRNVWPMSFMKGQSHSERI